MAEHPVINLTKRERVHGWFELSYAAYLVLPRSVLQSLPDDLQDELVTALEKIGHYLGADAVGGVTIPHRGTYHVFLRDERGRFIEDPLRNYDRGRRVVTREELEALCKGQESS